MFAGDLPDCQVEQVMKKLHSIFLLSLVIHLIYFWIYRDKSTANDYEYYYAQQALGVLGGRGMVNNDDQYAEIEKLHGRFADGGANTPLIQPTNFPGKKMPDDDYHNAYAMPFATWFLALIWKCVPHHFVWPKLIQALISAVMIYPIYGITLRLFNKRAALLSSLLYAIWLPLAYSSTQVSGHPWPAYTQIIAIYLLVRFLRTDRPVYLMLSSMIFAISVMARETLVIFVVTQSLFAIPLFTWKRWLKVFTAVYIVTAVVLGCWLCRNMHSLGKPVLLRTGFYGGILSGISHDDPVKYGKIEPYTFEPKTYTNGTRVHLYGDMSEFWKPVALDLLKHNPKDYLKWSAIRLLKTPFLHTIWGFEILGPTRAEYKKTTGGNFIHYLKDYPVYVAVKILVRLMEVGLVVMSFLVFWIDREKWRESLFIVGCYYVFVLCHAPFDILTRFITPHVWALLVLAAAGISALTEKRKSSLYVQEQQKS